MPFLGCSRCSACLLAECTLSFVMLLQAACTPKELKEIVTMPTIAVSARPEQMAVSDADKAEMKAVRLKRRIFELISNVRKKSTLRVAGVWVLLWPSASGRRHITQPATQTCQSTSGVLLRACSGVDPAGSRRVEA